jgi:hypothetical protein
MSSLFNFDAPVGKKVFYGIRRRKSIELNYKTILTFMRTDPYTLYNRSLSTIETAGK